MTNNFIILVTGHQQTTGSMSAAQLAQLHQRQQQLQQLRLQQQLQMDATQKQQVMQQQVRFLKNKFCSYEFFISIYN